MSEANCAGWCGVVAYVYTAQFASPINVLRVVRIIQSAPYAVLEFSGCAIVSSHDLWFLDRIATYILLCEGKSQWNFFAGNYSGYEEDKRKRLSEEAAKPKQIRYKTILR